MISMIASKTISSRSVNPRPRIALRKRDADMASSVLRRSKKKGGRLAAARPLLPLRNLSAAADQQAVVVEALTTPGFAAVLV